MSRTAIIILVLMAIACAAVIIVVLGVAAADKQKKPCQDAPPEQSWWAKKSAAEKQKIDHAVFVAIITIGAIGLLVAALLGSSGGTKSSSGRYMSEQTKGEAYYNMVATQDQNPYSNVWNEGVKEAAAKHYGVPMSTINDIIREGASENWLTPRP